MTHVQGDSAWQIRFEEAPDSNQPFQAIRVGGAMYLPRLKGRAWVASDRFEVLRMETDLVSPIPQINFNLEHLVINYAPVKFRATLCACGSLPVRLSTLRIVGIATSAFTHLTISTFSRWTPISSSRNHNHHPLHRHNLSLFRS